MPVAFEEIEPPRFRVDQKNDFHGRRVFLINFLDTAAFMLELYGGWQVVGGQTFLTPPSYFPSFPGCVCVDVSAEGWPTDSPQSTTLTTLQSPVTNYQKSKVEAIYGPRTVIDEPGGTSLSVPDGTYLTVDGFVGGEMQPLPGNALKWGADATNVGVALPDDAMGAVLLTHQEFSTVWSRVPRPPWSVMRTNQNTVNNATFLGFAAGYVLYLGTEFSRSFSVTSVSQWTLRHKFKARSQPWNYTYNKTDSTFRSFVKSSGSDYFASSTFANLFVFG